MRDCLIRSVCRHVLPMVCLAGFSARAQEALIDAMANDEIAQTRAKQAHIGLYLQERGFPDAGDALVESPVER